MAQSSISKKLSLSYTPEDTSNKAAAFSAIPGDVKYPTEKLVSDTFIPKVSAAVENNIAIFDSEGNVVDSDADLSDFAITSHIHSAATTAVAGFMSAADKTKLDGVATSANNYTHPATHSADIITDGITNKTYTATEKTKLSRSGEFFTKIR